MRAKAVICDGDKYLIAEILPGQYSGLWDFVGGHIPEDDTPENFLKKFVEENLGIAYRVAEWVKKEDFKSYALRLENSVAVDAILNQ